uniref:AlNc14C220G9096 protein n=1 Tax=Albugo laibachii Nc14 TaxID=890382 RepID=F0WRV1_9STRA|nr:AlNc14C220G9096 [Albugo laibachii Nc14]|eukprot:CCA24067.1 AlNc14C220G9096 [Albugo laibachii Nc14]
MEVYHKRRLNCASDLLLRCRYDGAIAVCHDCCLISGANSGDRSILRVGIQNGKKEVILCAP